MAERIQEFIDLRKRQQINEFGCSADHCASNSIRKELPIVYYQYVTPCGRDLDNGLKFHIQFGSSSFAKWEEIRSTACLMCFHHLAKHGAKQELSDVELSVPAEKDEEPETVGDEEETRQPTCGACVRRLTAWVIGNKNIRPDDALVAYNSL